MPIYDFECVTCAHRFERLQKISDVDPTDCPECGKPTVKRRLTAPAFRLSGTGWYETDFKKEGDTKRNLVSKDDSSGTSTSASTSSADSGSTPSTSAKSETPKADS